MKCSTLNQIDYNYLQGSNDPCLSGCSKIFPFGTLVIKNLISSITNSVSQGTHSDNDKESLLSLKPSSGLPILYNQFNSTSSEKSNGLIQNVVNSKYYDINQIQTLKIS